VTEQHVSEHPHGAGPLGGGQECVLCPVCVLIQAMASSHPEVTQHLVEAGRELTRALTTLLEARDDRSQRSEQRLHRVRVD
jgi:hypothetical protein